MARQLPFLERNLRRARVYGGRAARSALGAAPRHPCLFMHMPKCGGTSIAEAMYATVPLGRGVAVLDAVSTRRAAAILAFGCDDPLLCHEDLDHGAETFRLREAMALQAMAWGSQLVHGHLLWSERAERAFGDRYRTVTLLRDPYQRTVSNYWMARRAGIAPANVDAWLDSPLAANHARVYLRYLSGRAAVPDAEVPGALALARERLGRIAVLGVLSDLDGFRRRYADAFGATLIVNGYNRGTGEPPRLTPAQAERVEALCAPDRALYDLARAQGAAG